uniref:C3H1-type domain-containing protein n=1 Tax=Lankesteria abbotti TaxID=340204 RepID=A0A7S2VT85_9APIC|mmetsp:Transcript_1189/g.1345  ORF Transcript_1189/g.1345 Transcript_1189/m.1345 type:complete len:399 (+) Transcript_1189:52-1248(+)
MSSSDVWNGRVDDEFVGSKTRGVVPSSVITSLLKDATWHKSQSSFATTVASSDDNLDMCCPAMSLRREVSCASTAASTCAIDLAPSVDTQKEVLSATNVTPSLQDLWAKLLSEASSPMTTTTGVVDSLSMQHTVDLSTPSYPLQDVHVEQPSYNDGVISHSVNGAALPINASAVSDSFDALQDIDLTDTLLATAKTNERSAAICAIIDVLNAANRTHEPVESPGWPAFPHVHRTHYAQQQQQLSAMLSALVQYSVNLQQFSHNSTVSSSPSSTSSDGTSSDTAHVRMAKPKHASRFYKTKMCPYMNVKGRCCRTSKCVYAHSTDELRELPDLQKTKLCTNVKVNGICSDPSCRFAHSLEDLRHTDLFFKTKLCHMWKKGRCSSGVLCRHAHGVHDLKQ